LATALFTKDWQLKRCHRVFRGTGPAVKKNAGFKKLFFCASFGHRQSHKERLLK